ncbi:hypothetical protein [Leptothoe sp. PORK10 BA2]|uniref:hypothetical protein n=1 Tax=Leptothoe sp. PORK10 BA2 TaxID=3110254 RepID=UPI002B213DC7|nr:hypothetical protein [Leptothoe sp. PORK10 BA2]MEA5464991.1 hypothetical protein [Leptothoe sp. PORK10 BA2]
MINRDFVPAFREMLQQLMPSGVTVVFTCRDHDYNDHLEPIRERLPGLTRQIERFDVPNFTPSEIRLAASAFFHQRADDFPEPDTSDRGTAFADNILALSADSRSLLEIIQNPLLLALLCDLFAQEGNVPPDLTVSKLYQRYWQEKIAYSRVDKSHFAPLALAKDKLCLTLAQTFVDVHQLTQLLYQLLLGINIIQIDNSEAEMIQIIAAIQRLNPCFLPDAIATVCPQLIHQGWERNVAAIVRAIDNIEGRGSDLLDGILQKDWCTAHIESVVLEVKSGF